jgi:hypothetical protein
VRPHAEEGPEPSNRRGPMPGTESRSSGCRNPRPAPVPPRCGRRAPDRCRGAHRAGSRPRSPDRPSRPVARRRAWARSEPVSIPPKGCSPPPAWVPRRPDAAAPTESQTSPRVSSSATRRAPRCSDGVSHDMVDRRGESAGATRGRASGFQGRVS